MEVDSASPAAAAASSSSPEGAPGAVLSVQFSSQLGVAAVLMDGSPDVIFLRVDVASSKLVLMQRVAMRGEVPPSSACWDAKGRLWVVGLEPRLQFVEKQGDEFGLVEDAAVCEKLVGPLSENRCVLVCCFLAFGRLCSGCDGAGHDDSSQEIWWNDLCSGCHGTTGQETKVE